MDEIEKLGHLIRIGLSFGKINFQEVINWADRSVETNSNQEFFTEISLSKTTNEIIEVLHKRIQWNFNSPEIRNLILGYYKKRLDSNRYNWELVQKELMDYYNYLEFEDANNAVEDPIYCLYDDYSLRTDGFGGMVNMPGYLIEILSEFDFYPDLQNLFVNHSIEAFIVK